MIKKYHKCQLKFVLRERITDGPHETPEFIDEGVPFLSVDGIENNELNFENCRYISKEDFERYSKKAVVEKNDILMGKAASVGKIARVKVDFEFGVWSPLAIIKPDENKILPEYLEYFLQSDYINYQVEILSTSNTQQNISMDDIERLQIIFPSVEKQKLICKTLNKKVSAINDIIKNEMSRIDLLNEYKKKLISENISEEDSS